MIAMLDALKTLVVVAEEGSVNKAAERLRLTQPAVTRKLQRLEEVLDASLLDRRVKPAKLTPAGLIVLSRGRAILKSLHELKDCVSRDAEPNGTIRIGIAHGLSEPGLAELVTRFRERFPRLNPSFVSDLSPKLLGSLNGGTLDAALVLSDPVTQSSRGDNETCVANERVSAFSGRHVTEKPPSSLHEAATAAWVVNPQGCHFRKFLAQTLMTTGGELSVAAEVHDLGLQAALVVAGLGLGFLPERFVAAHPLRRELRRVPVRALRTTVDIVLVRASQLGPLRAAVEGFEDAARSWFASRRPVLQRHGSGDAPARA